MISEAAFDKACKAAGAKQVSEAALNEFDAVMTAKMNAIATAAVASMTAAKRVRIEPADITA
jgi:histone H3/H4